MNFFTYSSILWTAVISRVIYFDTVLGLPQEKILNSRKEVYYGFGCVFVPALVCILPLWTKSYGEAGFWCWIKANKDTMHNEAYVIG
jgi:hypothetical protein